MHLLVVATVVVVADGLAVVRAGEVEHGARLRVDELVRPAALDHIRLRFAWGLGLQWSC